MVLSNKVSLDARKLSKLLDFSTTSSIAGRMACTDFPSSLLKPAIQAYIKAFGVDMQDAARGVEEYRSFGDFFARELKPGARPVDPRENVLVSPADGLFHNWGNVEQGFIEQVKGQTYSIAELLDDPVEARKYTKGSFATIYLSPADYHRVHSPMPGSVVSARYSPGALYSVQPFVTKLLKNLFVANERISIHLETPHGRVCVVMVAATIVGRVSLAFSSLETNGKTRLPKADLFSRPIPLSKGAELGIFHIGSTVVLLTERRFAPTADQGSKVRMGQQLMELR